MRNKILIVDDEPGIRFAIRDFLEAKGYQTAEAADCVQAEECMRTFGPDAAIIDLVLPDGGALDLVPRLRAIEPAIPLAILTAHGSIDLAVRAIKEGAEQFLTKPIELPALLLVLERMLESARSRQSRAAHRSRERRDLIDPFVGTSAAIRELAEAARKIASTDSSVLILGETGTGKGVLANWLHLHSRRTDEVFLDLNCAGVPRDLLESELFGYERGAFTGAVAAKPGLFEIAHRGTVFLDEIGDADLLVQAKLLKVLEDGRFRRVGDIRDRRVDIRLITATHRNLQRLIGTDKFRSDLYFRISAVPLLVPPLRERVEDIPAVARRVLERLSAELGGREVRITPDAEAVLQAHAWPGNIRELRNVFERAILLGSRGVISTEDLRFDAPAADEHAPGDTALTLVEVERRHIERVLHLERGHVGRAARRLGTPRSSLYQKIKEYGIIVSGT